MISDKTLEDGAKYYKVEDEELMPKESLKQWYESLKEKQKETLEAVPALEADEDDPENSVLEGFDPNDPYFVELYCSSNPEVGSYLKLLNKMNVFKEEEEYNLIKDM